MAWNSLCIDTVHDYCVHSYKPWARHPWGCLIGFSSLKLKLKHIYFLLSATSSMPLALYNGTHTLVWIQWTHTYTYTVKYSTHTSIHTWQPFRSRYNVFMSGTHTLTLVDVVSGPCLPDSWSISSSEESTKRATIDAPASTAPRTTYVNSATRGAAGTAFSLQVR